jgi:4-amino-4-deoxy-L-arabinose transferase-like glycosyltransferase
MQRPSRRDLAWLGGAIALGLAVRIAFVAITHHQALAGDEVEYDVEGRLIAAGKWFWTFLPYGIPHASAWKAPGYPAWVGALYSIVGAHPAWVEAIQVALLGPLTIALTWLLGRRLFGPSVGLAAAFVVAVYPLAWQYEARLYSESLATPLTLAAILLFLDRMPSVRRAAAFGVVLAALLLVRPSSGFLLAGAAGAWIIAAGWWRGAALTLLAVAVAVFLIAPWSIRNHHVLGAFVPISMQDAAAYGTFNDTSANDPKFPFAWRPIEPRDAPLFDRRHPLSDARLRSILNSRVRHYISEHPFSVVEAFFWNGISRLWDIRRPAYAVDEVRFEGRSKVLTIAGLAMYYVLAPLALAGLWLSRGRREIVVPLLLTALAASVVFTIDSGTRYRAPLEPVIVVLACSAVARTRYAPAA